MLVTDLEWRGDIYVAGLQFRGLAMQNIVLFPPHPDGLCFVEESVAGLVLASTVPRLLAYPAPKKSLTALVVPN